MRIALVTATFPPYWGGTGNVVWYTARALSDRGHEVVVLTPRRRGVERHGPEHADGFTLRYVRSRLRWGNAAWVPPLDEALDGFDVVHLHYPFIGGAESVAAASRRRGIPLVLTYHNRLESTEVVRRFAFATYSRWVEAQILAAADVLVVVNDALRDALWGRKWDAVVLGHGVDTALFRPMERAMARHALGISPAAAVALFVGALDAAHRFKNVEGLLLAWRRFVRIPDSQLLIVGAGDRKMLLERAVGKWQLASRVLFMGERVPEMLPRLYSAADLTVLPSASTETFGLVLLESMACGTPVLATALPGVREVVGSPTDGGWLVPPGNVEALGTALQEILSLPATLRTQIGERARHRVVENYSWSSVAKELENVYREAIRRRRAVRVGA